MPKVLIVHPDFQRLGGIETYFLKLRPHLNVAHEFFPIARRPGELRPIDRLSRILADYRKYWSALSRHHIDIVHINPSLEPKSFYREGLFLLMAKLRRKKTLVFFHGWKIGFQQQIDNNEGRLFRLIYGNADAYIVLASSFADKLKSWGITQPIYSEVTIMSDDAIAAFDLEQAIKTRLEAPRWRLLFPSRLMRSKGIITTIKALRIIQKTHPQFELLVAGDGELANEARELVKQLAIEHVHFLGVVTGNKLYELFQSAHILCFPTEHDEGFPNIIVEAMSFGLPVVTRPVGGIPDFFESGIHGYLSESTLPEDFAKLIISIAENPERYRQMARANYEYARTHFLASQAALRLERIYASIQKTPA